MSKFTDTVKQDTPRLVVMFRRPAPDQEQYQWGMVGSMPLLTLIGYVTRVQSEIKFDLDDEDTKCDQSGLVIAWDAEKREFSHFIHPDVPTDSMVGMLETIKAALVDSQLAQHIRNNQVGLLGPDGQPMRRR